MAVIVCLHLIVLPTVSGGYNDECFLPDENRQILRTMVQNISRAFDKFGVQYWLDYGEFYVLFRLFIFIIVIIINCILLALRMFANRWIQLFRERLSEKSVN